MMKRRNNRWMRLMMALMVLGAVMVSGRGVDRVSAAMVSGGLPTSMAASIPQANPLATEASAFNTSADGYTEVFTDTFTSTTSIKPEWYPAQTWNLLQSPNGKILLGGRGGEVRSLNLTNLAPHSKVRLSFDFYTIYPDSFSTPWYGTYHSNPAYNHHFKVDTSSTQGVDFDNTFCTASNSTNYRQSYPTYNSSCTTGNTGINTLGYPNFGSNVGDARYRLSLTFDHTQSAFDASFMGTYGYNGNAPLWGIDNVTVEIFVADPPEITRQPAQEYGYVLTYGWRREFDVVLDVDAVGTGPLSYQWYKDGNLIVGATSDTYNLHVGPLNRGVYYVIVSSPYGWVDSRYVLVESELRCPCYPVY